MPNKNLHTAQHSLQGMLLAVTGFACLSIGDGVVKSMAGQIPGTEIALIRYAFGALGLAVALLLTRGAKGFVCPKPLLQMVRGASVAAATFGFFMALQYMPLANANAIQFTSPMIAAVLSALLLGERAPRAVWVATAIAFVGVLIVLRPQVFLLGWAAFYPLVAAVAMASLMIANRKAAAAAPLLELQFLVAAIATPFLLLIATTLHLTGLSQFALKVPAGLVLLKCATVAVTATFSHWLIFMATQRATAAVVSPMMYVQLLVAIMIGYVFFNTVPTPIMLLGAAIIIGAGLYLAFIQYQPTHTAAQENEGAISTALSAGTPD